jgi:hypothetical protein
VPKRALRSLDVLALALVGLSACSPYDYGKEVGAISNGVDQLSSATTSGYASLNADRAAVEQRLLIEDRANVGLTPSCGVAVSNDPASKPPCGLVRLAQPISAPTRPAPDAADDPEQSASVEKKLEVLTDYVHALSAVTNAADRAVSQLSGAVKGFAAFAPGIGQAAPAAVDLLGWLVGTALDQQRFATLRHNVLLVETPVKEGDEPPIHVVAETVGVALETIGFERRKVLYQEAGILVWRLGPGLTEDAYRQRLTEMSALVGTLEGLRRNSPAAAVKALETAHQSLAVALQNPKPDMLALVKAIGELKSKVDALKNAMAASGQPTSKAK